MAADGPAMKSQSNAEASQLSSALWIAELQSELAAQQEYHAVRCCA
jgi:hypothetical protein